MKTYSLSLVDHMGLMLDFDNFSFQTSWNSAISSMSGGRRKGGMMLLRHFRVEFRLVYMFSTPLLMVHLRRTNCEFLLPGIWMCFSCWYWWFIEENHCVRCWRGRLIMGWNAKAPRLVFCFSVISVLTADRHWRSLSLRLPSCPRVSLPPLLSNTTVYFPRLIT